ncbi:unnamed protein product [Rotaria sordida]|uniref:F-box domain-containing protein n=1 Tax=Rotaria sordida TaxID=392033 RepID=A0A819WCC3_9BILA|nr:unnamed protein product [Rotaria sordida]
MNSHFEIFSPEILYEIFDYLSISDIFHAFINLNHYLNNIINLYSLKYFNFDYLSHYLTNLTLIYLINTVDFSHKLIQNYLMKLSNLKYLTLSIALDLIDDVIFNPNQSILLDSFQINMLA